MMLAENMQSAAPLPPPRSTLQTLPFALDDYARQSCLPDADDELVFEGRPPLGTITKRVPFRVKGPTTGCSRDEALILALVDGISPVGILIQMVDRDPAAALITLCDLYARGLLDFY